MICTSGDKPGEGYYECYACGEKILLEDHEELPRCEKCSGNCFKKK